MSADRILAIDVGTQSVRAMVVRPGRQPPGAARRSRSSRTSRARPAAASRTPSSTGASIGEACRRLWAMPEARRDALAGVALTTQRGTVVVTDEAGAPLRPRDRLARPAPRRGPAADRRQVGPRVPGRRRHARRSRRSWPRPRPTSSRASEPETWARIRHYLLLSGFLAHRLTGRFVDSVASQVGYLPFDYKALALGEARRLEVAGDPDRPRVAARARAARQHARDDHGRPPPRPPGSPRACRSSPPPATRPARCWARGRSTRTSARSRSGTTATINTTHRRYVEVDPDRAAVPGRDPGRVQPRGPGLPRLLDGRVVQARVRRRRGRPGGGRWASSPETLFDELLAATPPGSMGLVLQPYWSPGRARSRARRRRARSSAGATSTPGPTSTARSSRASPTRCARAPSGPCGARGADRPSCASPAAGRQSPAAVQLTADIFGLPASRPHTHETSGPGRGDRRGRRPRAAPDRSRRPWRR